MTHVLDDCMMWKIRCALHDSMISKPTQFSQYYHFCILHGFESDYVQRFLFPKVYVVHAVSVPTSEAA